MLKSTLTATVTTAGAEHELPLPLNTRRVEVLVLEDESGNRGSIPLIIDLVQGTVAAGGGYSVRSRWDTGPLGGSPGDILYYSSRIAGVGMTVHVWHEKVDSVFGT